MPSLRQKVTMLAQAGALCVSLAQNAGACAFHGYAPDPTLVDVLLGSEHVVLARPDPSNPRHYEAVAALVGPTDAVDIPILVDAETRSRLKRNPAGTVLFARDGAYGPWLKLATLDESYRAAIDTVVARQNTWRLGDDEDRYQVFASLLNDPNPDVRRLALQELDRAEYSLLRDIKIPDVAGLHEDLETGDPDLRPIRILIAGLSRDKSLAPVLSTGLETAVKKEVPYLGAYATALIELAGADAVHHILNRHLEPAALSIEVREKIIEALAIHSQTGAEKTKRGIRRSVADLLGQSPELAGAVARQFGFRSDWSMSEPLKRAISERPPTTVADIFAVNQYIGVADRSN